MSCYTAAPMGPDLLERVPSAAVVDRQRAHFAFGGVEFCLSLASPLNCTLESAMGAYCMAPDGAPVVAAVHCDVHFDPLLGRALSGLNDVHWQRVDGAIRLVNNRVCADIVSLEPGEYRVRARMANTGEALSALLRYVGAAVIEAEGGLNLHAASVDLSGEAIGFCGPSGAGKSTAVDLCPSGRCLSYDQLIVYPHRERYWAWAMPWGNSSSLPRGTACALPLRALLRVTRGQPATAVRWAEPSGALFVVRDATTVSDYTVAGEESRLSAALSLCDKVRVGHLNTVLGERVDVVLKRLLCLEDRSSPVEPETWS